MSNNILLDKYNKINKKLTNLQINNSNKQYISMLLCIYMLSVIIRFLIAIIERQPHIMGDELSYTAMAYNFYKMGNFYPIQNYGVVTNLPNILYQFVISFSFYFGENFYIIIKLINCLLISLIIFPGYMLLKEYMTKDKAVIYTSMTILIPFNNITSFAMAENLFFPLFSISFYFSYKLITEYKHKYVIFTSFSITLLYLTKPHAIALILSLIATIFIIFIHSVICKNSTNQKQSIVVLVKVLICTTLMLFSITFIIKGQISVEALLGAYKKSTLTGNKIVYPIGDFFKMALSHITITSIVYFVPIIVCIYVIIKGLRKESMVSKNKVILSILSLMTFCAFLAMTIKFTIYIYKDEHFLRLHARYYYMTFICLYYAAICFINDIKLNKIHKLMVILGFAIINIVNYCISLPIYASPWATLSDNMDIYWFADNNKLKIAIIFIISIISLLKFITNKNARRYFIVYYIIISLVANIAIIKNKILVMNPYFATINNNRMFVEGNIPDKDAKVMLLDSSYENRTNIAFWLHYNYTDIKVLPKGSKITKEMIPEDTQYIVAFDEFEFDFDSSRINRKDSKCYIIDLRKDEDITKEFKGWNDNWTKKEFSYISDDKFKILQFELSKWQPSFSNTLHVETEDKEYVFDLTNETTKIEIPYHTNYKFKLDHSFNPMIGNINKDDNRELGIGLKSVKKIY